MEVTISYDCFDDAWNGIEKIVDRGDFQFAVDICTKLVSEESPLPNSQKAWFLWKRGAIFTVSGNLELAEKDYCEVIERYPDAESLCAALSLFNRGNIRRQKLSLDLAKEDFQRVTTIPETPREVYLSAMLQLGTICFERDDYQKTFQVCDEIVKTRPQASCEFLAPALALRGQLLVWQREFPQGIADINKAIELYEEDKHQPESELGLAVTLLLRAQTFFFQHQFPKALADLSELIDKYADLIPERMAHAFCIRAHCQTAEGHHQKANGDLERVLALGRDETYYWRPQAIAAFVMGKALDDIKACFDVLDELSADETLVETVVWLRAYLFFVEEGNAEAAIAALETPTGVDPSPDCIVFKGLIELLEFSDTVGVEEIIKVADDMRSAAKVESCCPFMDRDGLIARAEAILVAAGDGKEQSTSLAALALLCLTTRHWELSQRIANRVIGEFPDCNDAVNTAWIVKFISFTLYRDRWKGEDAFKQLVDRGVICGSSQLSHLWEWAKRLDKQE